MGRWCRPYALASFPKRPIYGLAFVLTGGGSKPYVTPIATRE
jgi:hypothetical protein